MRMSDNHLGWVVERLTPQGWIPCSHIVKTKAAAEYIINSIRRYNKETEFRLYEAVQ